MSIQSVSPVTGDVLETFTPTPPEAARPGSPNVIQWKQQTQLGRESGVTFGNPDFVELARAFGAKSDRVESAPQLGPILAEAIACDGPSIVDVPVDYRGNAKLTARLGQLGCPI